MPIPYLRLLPGLFAVLLLVPAPVAIAAGPTEPVPVIQATIQPIILQKEGESLPGVTHTPPKLTLPHWQTFPSGLTNSITDVPGVQVGHVTFHADTPASIRTGITAIVPDSRLLTQLRGNLANTGFRAGGAILNGNGEMTGLASIMDSGVLNSPILLTNTRAVSQVHEGVHRYFETRYPGQWPGMLPVVAECWDGRYNDISYPAIQPDAAIRAIESASSGPVLQGRVGAGTGMRSFGLHGGIGSASREITYNGREYILGVLVNTNHSSLESLNPSIRQELERVLAPLETLKAEDDADLIPRKPPQQGSIIVIIATNLPLSTKALEQIARHAGLGIANTGSHMAVSSGDFALAFSTAHPILLDEPGQDLLTVQELHPNQLSPVFQATVEAVTEAQINALTASHHHHAHAKAATKPSHPRQ